MSLDGVPPIVSFMPAIIGVGGGVFILLFSVPIYLWTPKPGGLIRAAGEKWVTNPESKTAILRHTCRGASAGAFVMILIGIVSLFLNLSEHSKWIIPLSCSPIIIVVPSIQSLFFAWGLKKKEGEWRP
jgi:hypothetical protein